MSEGRARELDEMAANALAGLIRRRFEQLEGETMTPAQRAQIAARDVLMVVFGAGDDHKTATVLDFLDLEDSLRAPDVSGRSLRETS